jgi:hypothetical protein
MAKKYLTAIDLNKNELQNASIQNLASAPASPVSGQIYFNTTDKLHYIYNGTAWDKFTPSGAIVNADIASNAAIALSKLATDPLARANHTGTQTASTISDLATTVQGYRLDQFASPTSSVAFNSQKITGLADPTSAQDAATKAYVDAVKTGLDVKDSVRVATTANITLSGTQTIDGVSVIAGDRVLVKNQTTGSENGIYVAAAGAWSRSADADASAEVTGGLFTFVNEGTTNADSGWVLATNDSITLGTTSLSFVQFSGAGQITAGAGLTKTGNTLDVVGTANRILVNADSIDIASTYVGQTSITTLGTITSGTWNGTTIGVANGGTGATTLTGFIKGNGTSAFTAQSSIALGTDVSGTLPIANGGTGATTASAARTALGLVIGTDVQAYSSVLASVAGGTWTGSSSITTLGTITSGTWNGTTIAIANGGTGATTAAGARTALSATGKYSATNSTITPSSGIATWTVTAATHGLGAVGSLIAQMKEVTSGSVVEADVVVNDSTGDVTVSWNAASSVTSGTYRLTIIG